jgi:hypothetical protein
MFVIFIVFFPYTQLFVCLYLSQTCLYMFNDNKVIIIIIIIGFVYLKYNVYHISLSAKIYKNKTIPKGFLRDVSLNESWMRYLRLRVSAFSCFRVSVFRFVKYKRHQRDMAVYTHKGRDVSTFILVFEY